MESVWWADDGPVDVGLHPLSLRVDVVANDIAEECGA